MANTPPCHGGDPGSNPGVGVPVFCSVPKTTISGVGVLFSYFSVEDCCESSMKIEILALADFLGKIKHSP